MSSLHLERATDASPIADAVWGPVMRNGLPWWLESPGATAAWFGHESRGVPLTVSGATGDRTPPWSTSCDTMFGEMAIEEGQRLPSPVARTITTIAAPIVRALTRGLDPVVAIGSYGMSTYLHTDEPELVLAAACAALEQWPSHVPVIRSIDAVQTPRLLAALRDSGWILIPARQVWHSDTTDHAMWHKRDTLEDQKLLKRTPLERRSLEPHDAAALVALYEQLYLGKYSRFNPRVRVSAVTELLATGGLSGEAFFDGNRMVSAYAAFTSASQMTATMVGYELAEPSSRGLYRLAVAASLARAGERGLRLHMSAGADRFKQLRGARPVIEYLATDLRNMHPAHARRWKRLSALTNALAPRIFRDAR